MADDPKKTKTAQPGSTARDTPDAPGEPRDKKPGAPSSGASGGQKKG